MTRTTSFAALVALAMLARPTTAAPSALVAGEPEAAPETTAPVITYSETPTADQRQVVEWAVARYAEAGLTLPALEISFPAMCGGKAGRYFVGQNRIEICKLHRTTILHELAHAWDDTTSVDRAGFLQARGIDHWYEQPGERSYESGGEQLALIMTWGLMDVDLTHAVAEWAGQPIDEQPRSLPGLADSTPQVLAKLFTQLTGSSALARPGDQPARSSADHRVAAAGTSLR